MSNQISNNYNSAGGFCSLLAITFIVLKLCNIIDWSWWWVLAPLWIPVVLIIIIAIVVVFIINVIALMKK